MTLEYYNQNALTYATETQHLDMQAVYERFIGLLSPGATLLDLGCGSGRDAKYFKEQGMDVTAVDGSAELAALAEKYLDQPVLVQDFLELALPKNYEAIWACASLLHLPKTELPHVLQTLHAHLSQGSVFYASFKGDKQPDGPDAKGRYFAYYDAKTLQSLFVSAGFVIKECWTEEKPLRDHLQIWHNIIVTK
jgi:cyclopropane fatty-acyl-phospholipid synthase-like methyltransferase